MSTSNFHPHHTVNNINNNENDKHNDESVYKSRKIITTTNVSSSSSSSNSNTTTTNYYLIDKLLRDCLITHGRRHNNRVPPTFSPPTDHYKRRSIVHHGNDNSNNNKYNNENNDFRYRNENDNNIQNSPYPSPFNTTCTSSRHSHRRRHNFRRRTITSSSFYNLQEEREQALRDYKVTIEYKHLKSHAPGGVYLIPSMGSLREFHGIIFVRRGLYTNGIFKFKLTLPPKYNDVNMWPQITFFSRVYNPYVNEKTGELDVQSAYPTWDPSRHYLVTILTYLKKIFYSKTFLEDTQHVNNDAKELSKKDPNSYKKKVERCVHESQKNVYINDGNSTAKFTEEEVAHRVLRDLLKYHIRNENQVTKQAVMTQIEKARKV